ncbi:MAG TPA: hypothetical protein VMG12_04400, partial [Polyangiaceae bacterium]|nr:hypothetical protein [Polyangiaceae bacterium]
PFLYQSIMEVLQSSPQFFKPISLAAQGVSFAFAALRFFFFGVVVGFVTRAVRTKDLSAA